MESIFKINSVKTQYVPETLEKIAEFNIKEELDSVSKDLNSQSTLIISRVARKKIFDHIKWGESTSKNLVEQGGILVGHSYIIPEGEIFGFCHKAIPASSAEGSSAYVRFGHSTWKEMMDVLDKVNADEEKEYQIIGWYHTHPGSLSVFMSGTDMNTQRSMFSKDWQFAIVLNPQKKIWKAFIGEDAKICKGQMEKQLNE